MGLKEWHAMKTIQRIVFLMLVCVLAVSAIAQTSATAELRGTVKDPNGAVIQGATVIARDDAKNVERSTVSNGAGEYVLLSIPPGSYTITVTAKGFSKMVAKDVTLTVGQAAVYPVTM